MKEKKNKERVALVDVIANAKSVNFAFSMFRAGYSDDKNTCDGGMVWGWSSTSEE